MRRWPHCPSSIAAKAQVVELRYFGGLSVEETAEVLGISPETAKRDWKSTANNCDLSRTALLRLALDPSKFS